MNIAIVGTQGVPGKYGGFETLAENLIKYLPEKYNISVFCSRKSYKERNKYFKSARRIFIPLKANGFQSIPYDIISIIISLFIAETIIILGVSGCIVLPLVKIVSRKKLIVSIDGLEWKRAKWSKIASWFLKLSEKVAVKKADKIISDNKNIKDYIYKEYNKQSELIAYGGDHAFKIIPTGLDIVKYPFIKDEYVFALSRIEPENNCDIILRAFCNNPCNKLVYIGNWKNSYYGKQLYSQFKDYDNILLIDPIYNLKELNVIRSNCNIYIHGHSAGGTNPALVEAMHIGLPIVAFDINFNRSTTHNKVLYFKNSKDLQENIEYLSLNKKLVENISEEIIKIAKQEYMWDNIIEKYEIIFNKC